MIYEDIELSTHFRLYEIIKSQTADRLGIDNSQGLTREKIAAAKELAIMVLEPIREWYGHPISPQSWYRSEPLEKELTKRGFARYLMRNGIPNSDQAWNNYFSHKSHPKAEAVDIELPGIANDRLYDWIEDNLKYDQLIREFPKENDPMSGWVHVSYSLIRNRQEVFTIG